MKIVPASTFVPLGGRGSTPTMAGAGAEAAVSRPSFAPIGGQTPLTPTAPLPAESLKSVGTASAPAHEPATLHLERDGDRITHIEVRCGCGQVHRLACTY